MAGVSYHFCILISVKIRPTLLCVGKVLISSQAAILRTV